MVPLLRSPEAMASLADVPFGRSFGRNELRSQAVVEPCGLTHSRSSSPPSLTYPTSRLLYRDYS